MIDFNSNNYTRKIVTKEALLEHISEADILSTYFPGILLNATISSPIRDDRHPSFSLFYSDYAKCIMFNDFARTREVGDLIVLVQKKYDLINYHHALEKIAIDFFLENEFTFLYNKKVVTTPKYSKETLDMEAIKWKLNIKIRPWEAKDLLFWKKFGISLPTLNKFNVVAISSYFVNEFEVFTSEYSYAYIEKKDNKFTYKVYRPFEDKAKKWRTDHNNSIHQGYMQLPKEGGMLIITKSLKDVMSLYEVSNISSIAVQAETILIKPSVLEEYYIRFTQLFTLFDNDQAGKELAFLYQKEFNITPLFIPDKEYKDYSDLIYYTGKINAKKILLKMIPKKNVF
jgi:hypothetical protein